MTQIWQSKIETEIGPMYLVASDTALKGVFWRKPSGSLVEIEECKVLRLAEKEIRDYLAGRLRKFTVPLDPEGTEFQQRVWLELRRIPYGQTKSYKDIATALGMPKACRAVGTANGRNPLSIIVPCHRVIAANGTLGGYAGGLPRKEQLLSIERGAKN